MKIKNRPDYLFNDNMIIKILSPAYQKGNYHSRVFLVLIFTPLKTTLQKVLIM